jgi:hypothetical protein
MSFRQTSPDILFLVGVVAVCAGLWFVWPPLTLIYVGLVATILGIAGAR